MAIDSTNYVTPMKTPKDLANRICRCRVENNIDPLHIGRVQVRIPLLHGIDTDSDSVPTESLPWASLCSPFGAGYNYGAFIVPEIGEYGFVLFEDGDTSKPVWIGSTYGAGSTMVKSYGDPNSNETWTGVRGANEVPMEAQRVSPTQKVVFKSHYGSGIFVDTAYNSEGIIVKDEFGQVLQIKSNTTDGSRYIQISNSEGVTLRIQDNKVYLGNMNGTCITVNPKDNSTLIKSGDSTINMTNDGAVNIKSSNSTLETDSLKLKASNTMIQSGKINMKGSVKVKGRIRQFK